MGRRGGGEGLREGREGKLPLGCKDKQVNKQPKPERSENSRR